MDKSTRAKQSILIRCKVGELMQLKVMKNKLHQRKKHPVMIYPFSKHPMLKMLIETFYLEIPEEI
jgi:hypothetical protein